MTLNVTLRRTSLAGILAATAFAGAASAQEQNPPPRQLEMRNLDIEDATRDLFRLERERINRETQEQTADGRAIKLTRGENKGIAPLRTAVQKGDVEAARAALPAAQAAAASPDAKYVVAGYQLQLAGLAQDRSLQKQGTLAAIESGVAPPALLPSLYRNLAVFSLDEGDLPAAEKALNKVIELRPADADAYSMLSQVRLDSSPAEARAYMQRAIDLKRASNQPVPEEWSKAAESMSTGG